MTDNAVTDDDLQVVYAWLNDGYGEDTPIKRVLRAYLPIPTLSIARELRELDHMVCETEIADVTIEHLFALSKRLYAISKRAEDIENDNRNLKIKLGRKHAESCNGKPYRFGAPVGDADWSGALEVEVDVAEWLRQYHFQSINPNTGKQSGPADVPSEEMWLIRTKEDQLMAGVRDPHGDWSVLAPNGFARECDLGDEEVTLVARLVPEPRVVTDPDELDKLPEGSVILCCKDVAQKALVNGWTRWEFIGDGAGSMLSPSAISCGPVIVLWEPEVSE